MDMDAFQIKKITSAQVVEREYNYGKNTRPSNIFPHLVIYSNMFIPKKIYMLSPFLSMILKVQVCTTGLELARVPRVPGTCRNSEHHLWHPRILKFLILTGTRGPQSSFYVTSGTLSFKFLTQALRDLSNSID